MSGHDVKTGQVKIFADGEAIAQSMAKWLLKQAQAKKNGPFIIALSGGGTPQRLYEILATAEYADTFPWQNTHLFFGDERFVPYSDAASNFTMVEKALLSHIKIPKENIHPVPVTGTPDEAAAAYQRELENIYGQGTLESGKPLFDVILLGLGTNGHTASLFPRTPVLHERTKWVSTCVPDDAPHTRITLTFPAIQSSRYVVFMLNGASKEEIFAKVRQGDPNEVASHITTQGELIWLVDKAAAGELTS